MIKDLRRRVLGLLAQSVYSSPEVMCGKNVELSLEGTILTIRLDFSQTVGPSLPGKTTIITSTKGNVTVVPDRDEKSGLNVYRARKPG